MLYELYQYLTSPCPRYVKDMGYLKEVIGMGARHRRCATAWSGHLQRCRDWISQSIEQTPRRGKVVVLGSGLLADVPIDDLADGFDQVVLVDILHLPVIRKALKAYGNVTLLSQDITGIAETLHRPSDADVVISLPVDAGLPIEDADLVVSLNVLSQIPIVPQEFAEKKKRALERGFSSALMSAHLQGLCNAQGKVCLITETEQRLCKVADIIETANPLEGVVIPDILKTQSTRWDWHFAPHPEKHPEYDLVYQVEGYLS